MKDKTHEFFSQNSKFGQIFTMRLQKFSLEITCYDNSLISITNIFQKNLFKIQEKLKTPYSKNSGKMSKLYACLKLKLKMDLKEYTPLGLQEIGCKFTSSTAIV